MSLNDFKFFQSELEPMLNPIAEKCKNAGYGLFVAIKSKEIDGTITATWNIDHLISAEHKQKIISLLGYLTTESQTEIQKSVE